MRRATMTILTAAAALTALQAPATATAQTVHHGAADVYPAWRASAPPAGYVDGLNAFFYPDGYDPQYGSEGRLPDAADFAAGYGCLPIWDGRYGHYVDACNPG